MRLSTAVQVITAVFLAAAVVLAPSFIGRRHPQPGPVAEAMRNLRMLKLLEERYFAEHGRYAPDPDAMARYKAGATDIQAALPDFRPGPPDGLSFDYFITSFGKGMKFTADARGRIGTAAAGMRISINQDSRYPEEVVAAEGVTLE